MYEQFHGLISAAANMPQPGELGTYTKEMFLTDFPQFKKKQVSQEEEEESQIVSLVPDSMLQVFINNSNASILPSRYGDIWRYAAGLYVAHFSALYLKTYSDGSATPARAAATGQQTGLVKEATMGDTTIRYDNEAITEASAKWGSWNATQYGQQLVTMARMIGMGGMYVI
ncbi:DUF4054 domain-containing protein [Clostridium sp. HBUAS56010]|uniref:DUF4054 domain-containing protein n=1 Tax=Clostridium sp. HBUAS56010 TaxID=2571127 RepID=UPI0011781251|nr:DUF4054 domain-containing protein [Clostridium sp. HBUAS56010]DAJ05439.1 MAG TPA: head to tail adaptor [Caudoviricetes sp.]